MTAANPKSKGSSDYTTWLTNVHSLLAHHRPDVDPTRLDPNETYQAHQSGVTPQAFVTQSVLPLRPAPTPSAPASAPSTTTRSAGHALGTAPEGTLVSAMWALALFSIALFFLGGPLRWLAVPLNLVPVALAFLLLARPSTSGRVHAGLKLVIDVLALAAVVYAITRGAGS